MTDRQNNTVRRKSSAQIIALTLTGVGMLILGGMAILLLAKPDQVGRADDPKDYPSAVPVPVDYPAPELELTDLEGRPVALSDYAGQVVLVNNWAFWCPPCRAELPVLQEYYKDHRQQGFTLLGIEAGGEKVDVDYHVKLYKLTYPIWLDPRERSLAAFQYSGLPNSAVIDRTGKVVLKWGGPISREMLEKYVTPLLEQ